MTQEATIAPVQDKGLGKSWMIVGGAAYLVTQFLESNGVVPSGTLMNAVKTVEGIVGLIGARRAFGGVSLRLW